MSYQKCPVCNGCGTIGIGFPTGENCRVCNGAGIISEQTGEPPKRDYEYTTTAEEESMTEKEHELTPCQNCHCITKTIDGKCGKCKGEKRE